MRETEREVTEQGVNRLAYWDADRRLLVLSPPGTSYVVAVAEDGRSLEHLYWGGRLGPEDPAVLFEEARTGRRRGGPTPLEVVPDGGLRSDEPSVRWELPGGQRSVELLFQEALARPSGDDGVEARIVLVDPLAPLRLSVCYRVSERTSVIERWCELDYDPGAEGPVVVHQLSAANWWVPVGRADRLVYLAGAAGRETWETEAPLAPGRLVLESRRGMTGHQQNPACLLTGSEDEEAGETWSTMLAWSGSWKLVVETLPNGATHVVGGWHDHDSPLRLLPGQSLATPVMAGLRVSGGIGGAARAWHDYHRHAVLRARPAAGRSPSFPATPRVPEVVPLRPVLYNSWEATGFDVSEDGQLELARRAAQLGVERFVVDDGWFLGRRSDHSGLGDWRPDPAKFPTGLGRLIAEVERLGMDFGLWVEPEMVNPDSELYRAHPDWVYYYPGRERVESRHQLVLNLARPDVSEWLFKTLDGLLSKYEIRFLKWDCNRAISHAGWPGEVNPERVWVEHPQALYRVLDQLRAAHPEVEIESCAGGGGRVDIGILSRVEQVWPSDNTDAADRLRIQEGFGLFYPPEIMMSWVTDVPNQMTGRTVPLSMRFHVAMMGALGIGGDLRRWSDDERREASALISWYKDVRPTIQRGRRYRLARVRDGGVSALQYVSSDCDTIVVLAGWWPHPFGTAQRRLCLRGLDRDASYYDLDRGVRRSGAYLSDVGLPLGNVSAFGSEAWRWRRETVG